MADIVDRKTRSRMMASVRRQDTGPEVRLRRLLWACGLRGYRVHRKDIPGTPDVAWIGEKVAIFVDGSFWHGHPSAYTPGKSGAFWDKKIQANIARDSLVSRELKEHGWKVLRFWDFEVKKEASTCIARVSEALGREL
jgi:DNA mismatch endonuclease, patch repair protein